MGIIPPSETSKNFYQTTRTDGRRTFSRNVDKFVPDYTTSHHR
jgi:hypothetical protein